MLLLIVSVVLPAFFALILPFLAIVATDGTELFTDLIVPPLNRRTAVPPSLSVSAV